jgi:hypothetical protein
MKIFFNLYDVYAQQFLKQESLLKRQASWKSFNPKNHGSENKQIQNRTSDIRNKFIRL